jgi:hypothetical protein
MMPTTTHRPLSTTDYPLPTLIPVLFTRKILTWDRDRWPDTRRLTAEPIGRLCWFAVCLLLRYNVRQHF